MHIYVALYMVLLNHGENKATALCHGAVFKPSVASAHLCVFMSLWLYPGLKIATVFILVL